MIAALVIFAILLLGIVGPKALKLLIFDAVDDQMERSRKYDPTMTDGQDEWWGDQLREIDTLPEYEPGPVRW